MERSMRIAARLGILSIVAGLAPALLAADASPPDDLAGRARRLHREAIVVDTHEDVPYALEEKWADVGERGATPHFDIPRAREGGLTAPFFAVYVPASYAEAGGPGLSALAPL